MIDISKAEFASYDACKALGRLDLYLDIKQDLLEMMLRRDVVVSSSVLYLRAVSFILSKRYNENYAGRSISVAPIYNIVSPYYDEHVDAERLLGVLPAKLRKVVVMWMGGYKHREIARLFGVSRSSVSKWLKSAFSIMMEEVM